MKNLFVAAILILAAVVVNGFAETGQGTMKDKAGELKRGHMMDHGKMMDELIVMTGDMSEMMSDMSDTMDDETKMTKDMANKISDVMTDMCAAMGSMSDMIRMDTATDEDMKTLRIRMRDMQKKMSDMLKE